MTPSNTQKLGSIWRGRAWDDGTPITRVTMLDDSVAEGMAALLYGWTGAAFVKMPGDATNGLKVQVASIADSSVQVEGKIAEGDHSTSDQNPVQIAGLDVSGVIRSLKVESDGTVDVLDSNVLAQVGAVNSNTSHLPASLGQTTKASSFPVTLASDTGTLGVSIADGSDVAQGTTSDVAWVSGSGTVISLLKKIASAGGSAVSIADGANVVEGATTDSAVITDTTGTVSGKLRGLVKWAFERMPAALGQTTMVNSLPVVIASNQTGVPAVGNVAHDAIDLGSPVKIGGKATNTSPTLVTEGDRVDGWFSRQGALNIILREPTGSAIEANSNVSVAAFGPISTPTDGVSNTLVMVKPQVTGNTSGTGMIPVIPFIFNGTTLDRMRTSSGDAQAGTGLPAAALMGYNGATWDRVRTASTGRLQVDVITGGGGTQFAEDAALGTTPTGMLAVARRVDSLATLTPIVDDAVSVRVNSRGALWVKHDSNIVADAGTGPWPVTDNAGSLTVDAPVGTPVFTRLSDGAAALIGQKVMASSLPVTLASDQTTIAVSAASLPLPTGAATDAELVTINTTLGTLSTTLATEDTLGDVSSTLDAIRRTLNDIAWEQILHAERGLFA